MKTLRRYQDFTTSEVYEICEDKTSTGVSFYYIRYTKEESSGWEDQFYSFSWDRVVLEFNNYS